jgi:Holliday junction DNA helicase RuvA
MILSSMTVDDFSHAIASNNVLLFKAVKGVGAKTAQRIIVDLKDKIKVADATLLEKADLTAGETFDEALAALVMLGFTQQASGRVLKSLFASHPTLTVEQAIKQALKMM